MTLQLDADGALAGCGLLRTARLLFAGEVFIPARVWPRGGVMMTIAFIGFGEAGGILAADLAREHAVTIWDCKLNGPEREAMGKKARDSRVQVGNSAGAGAGGGHAGFSTVTAGEALKVAQQASRCCSRDNISSISTPWRRRRNGRRLNIFCRAPTSMSR